MATGVVSNYQQTSFACDGLYRLTAESGPSGGHSYGYDLAGNRTNVDGMVYSFDSANKQNGLGHNGDGDVTSIPANAAGHSYALNWNLFGQVSYLQDDVGGAVHGVAYWYDGFGRRVASQPEPGVGKTFYIFDGDLLIGELSGYPVGYDWPSAVYTWGAAGLISHRSQWTSPIYYIFGPQGETRHLYNGFDIVDSYTYTAYGVPVSATGNHYNPFRFGGQFGYYTDQNGAQDIMLCGARWYDATLGRWLSRDPLGYGGGVNLYEYCLSDPVGSIDPSGFCQDPSELSDSQLTHAFDSTYTRFGGARKNIKKLLKGAETALRFAGDGNPGVLAIKATGRDPYTAHGRVGKAEQEFAMAALLFPVLSKLLPLHGMAQGRRVIVIGESMNDVRASAGYYGAKYWQSWRKVRSEEEWFRLNMRWIKQKSRTGTR